MARRRVMCDGAGRYRRERIAPIGCVGIYAVPVVRVAVACSSFWRCGARRRRRSAGQPRVEELTLALAPALILFGLLANGRYVGEDRIFARGEQAVPRLRSVLGMHWPPGRDAAFGSLVEHTPLSRRGPPFFIPAS